MIVLSKQPYRESALLLSGISPDCGKGLVQVSDSGAIAAVVSQAIAANPAQVEQYKAGNAKVLQYLVGQVMKLSKGKANPQLVVAELKKQLD